MWMKGDPPIFKCVGIGEVQERAKAHIFGLVGTRQCWQTIQQRKDQTCPGKDSIFEKENSYEISFVASQMDPEKGKTDKGHNTIISQSIIYSPLRAN